MSGISRPVSLRRRLLGLMFLVSALLVSINAALLWGYARGAANRSYDLLLAGAALSILERVTHSSAGLAVDLPYSALEIVGLARDDRVFYAVSSPSNNVLTGTENLSFPEVYAPSAEPVFYDADFQGTTLRLVVQARRVQTPEGRQWVSVQIGHTRMARDAQAQELFISGMSGIAVLSMIGLVFVWLAIGYALRPLASIESDLRSRDLSDFSPIALDPPLEVGSFISSINSYMSRLASARSLTETFIADVAHQTRTSLAALKGQIMLASDARDEPELRNRLLRVEQQVDKTVRLTNQLLSQAMVSHRADNEPLQSLRLEVLVRELLTEMVRDSALRNMEISFEKDIPSEYGDSVKGDPVSLREAIRNLIDNAVRHGPTDNQIEVSLVSNETGIVLSVGDGGPGIAEDQHNFVLGRFQSLDKATAGSGLGLPIVEQVANSHQATLTLGQSRFGGLQASLRFPPALLLLIMAFLNPSHESFAQTSLQVWSATDKKAMLPVIKEFEQSNPTIVVDYREFQTVELHNSILLSRPDNAPDVVISSAMDLQFDLVNRGLAHTIDIVTPLPEWGSWRSELFSFTFEPAVLIFSRDRFALDDLPRTHRELASFLREREHELEGRVGTYNVRESGVGYLYATQDAAQGQEALRITEALGRIRVQTFCCTSRMLEGVASGKLDLAYNVIGSYALAAASADARIGVALFDDYNLVMSRTAFVYRHSANKVAASRFLNYLLSPDGQQVISATSGLLSINDGAQKIHVFTNEQALSNEPSFLPIRLSAGLLTYLDQMKRRRFLENWDGSLAADVP
jgi:two-component system, OmpR family, sensor histidine kinase TctE